LILSTDSTNRRFEFHKRGQLFIRTHNETLSVIAVRVSNPRFHQRFAIIGVHSYCFACGARECSSKTMFPLRFIAITFSTILLLSGCQKKTAARNLNSQSKNESHENTKLLQAADLVGYDATNLRKSVDKITEDNDKHNKELENVIEDRQVQPNQSLEPTASPAR
jgi:hypothetical protein